MRTRNLVSILGASLLALSCGKSENDHDQDGRPDGWDSGSDAAAAGAAGSSGTGGNGGSGAGSGSGGTSLDGSAGSQEGGSAADAGAEPADAGDTRDAGPSPADAGVDDAAPGAPDGGASDADAEPPSLDAGSEAAPPDAALPDAADGNPCTGDSDDDSVCDELDNCPLHPNPEQLDVDGDGIGYVCDSWVELPAAFWNANDASWTFSLAARLGTIVISAGPRSASGGTGAALVLEGDTLATQLAGQLGSFNTTRSLVGSDGVGWVNFGASSTFRVAAGSSSSPYGSSSLYEAPGGGVFAITGSSVDLWEGPSTTALISGANGIASSFFNQVTYFVYDTGGGARSLAVYGPNDSFSILDSGATDIVPIGGVGGQLFCRSSGSSAELMLYSDGVPIAGWPFSLPSATCDETAQLAVRVGSVQRLNDPNGAMWYRTRDSSAGYVYLRAAGSQSVPVAIGTSLGKTNEILAPGIHRHANALIPAGTSEVLFFDGAALSPVLSKPSALGSVTRAGRDEVWLWWVEPVAGSMALPSRLYAGRLDGAAFSGPIELPVTGWSGHTVTWSELSPGGVLWLNVRHGGPDTTTYSLYSVDAGVASAGVPSGGSGATITWDTSGTGLLGTTNGVYLVDGTTLTSLATAISPYRRLVGPDDAGFTWITYETTPGAWALARWNDFTFDVVETNLSAAATGITDDTNTSYLTYGDGSFTFARLSGGSLLPLFTNLDVEPISVRTAGIWVGHTSSGISRLTYVRAGTASAPALYADTGMALFGYGGSVSASIRDRSGTVRVAICELAAADVACTDAGTGQIVFQTSAGSGANGGRVALATEPASGSVYLWHNVETVAADDCCAAASAGTSCGSPAVAACVCAANESCCTALWDASCAQAVEGLGCGICGP